MHAHRNNRLFLSRELDSGVSRQLIQRRLGRAIRVPSPQSIISNRAHARRPIRNHWYATVPTLVRVRRRSFQHQRRAIPHHHRRSDGVGLVRQHHVLGFGSQNRRLWTHAVRAREHGGNIGQEIKSPDVIFDNLGGGFDRGEIRDVHAEHAQSVAVRRPQRVELNGVFRISARRDDDTACSAARK